MADLRIYQLDTQATVDDAYFVPVDSADWDETKKMTVGTLLSGEVTSREDADDAIIAGAGLQANGSYVTDESTNYLKLQDFVDATVNASLMGADKLLDARIYYVENKLYLEVCQELTSAELLDISDTPVLALAAPQAGFMLDCKEILGYNVHGGVDYVGGPLKLVCGAVEVGSLPQTFVEASGEARYKGDVAANLELQEATEYYWTAAADFTNGNGTIKTRIRYEVVDYDLNCNANSVVNSACCNIPIYGSFVDADLDGADKLVITHNRNTTDVLMPSYVVDNNSDRQLATWNIGDASGNDQLNKVTIDVSAHAPITGTWTYYFIARV